MKSISCFDWQLVIPTPFADKCALSYWTSWSSHRLPGSSIWSFISRHLILFSWPLFFSLNQYFYWPVVYFQFWKYDSSIIIILRYSLEIEPPSIHMKFADPSVYFCTDVSWDSDRICLVSVELFREYCHCHNINFCNPLVMSFHLFWYSLIFLNNSPCNLWRTHVMWQIFPGIMWTMPPHISLGTDGKPTYKYYPSTTWWTIKFCWRLLIGIWVKGYL